MTGATHPAARGSLQCGNCGGCLHRSQRGNHFELLLAWAGVYPYRCADCRKRIYKRIPQPPAQERPPAPAGPKTHLPLPRSPGKSRWWRQAELLRTRREILVYGLALAAFLVLLCWEILSLSWPDPLETGDGH